MTSLISVYQMDSATLVDPTYKLSLKLSVKERNTLSYELYTPQPTVDAAWNARHCCNEIGCVLTCQKHVDGLLKNKHWAMKASEREHDGNVFLSDRDVVRRGKKCGRCDSSALRTRHENPVHFNIHAINPSCPQTNLLLWICQWQLA